MAITPDETSFEIVGPADAPTVVLIHGFGLNRDCWQWTIPALVGRYRVISYDLIGHGQSRDPSEEPSLSMFARQLRDLLNHCGVDRAVIIGFSIGGMIARRFAQDFPAQTRALVILHSQHKRSPEAQAAIAARVTQAQENGPEHTVEAALERWFTAPFRAANPDVTELVRGWVKANRKDVYHTIYRVLADGVDEITAPNPPISCPTLAITGDEDFGNGPEMTQAIANEIKGAQAIVLPGLRHMALAENPEAINKPILAFLESLDGKPAS